MFEHPAAGELQKLRTAADLIAEKMGDQRPRVGIILGTGLGQLAQKMEIRERLDYAEIPHFPRSTVESHHGKLLLGTLEGVPVMALQGRFHLYEGYSALEVVRPVRVMRLLGVDTLLVSNACGTVNPLFRPGEVMLMEDHINLLGTNPLLGPNLEELGPRFPDMSEPYSLRLRRLARETALRAEIPLRCGVYAAVAGPNLETRAEYRFLRAIGADVVGMSTVPETIAARHAGMEVLGISVITDECFPESLQPVKLEQILAMAGKAEPQLTTIMAGVTKVLGEAIS